MRNPEFRMSEPQKDLLKKGEHPIPQNKPIVAETKPLTNPLTRQEESRLRTVALNEARAKGITPDRTTNYMHVKGENNVPTPINPLDRVTQAEERRQATIHRVNTPDTSDTKTYEVPTNLPDGDKQPLPIKGTFGNKFKQVARAAALLGAIWGGAKAQPVEAAPNNLPIKPAITQEVADVPLTPKIQREMANLTENAPIQIDSSFEKYWNEHGGLAQQGLPVSEPFIEKAEDGRPYKVQYFERAKFELHPELAGTPYEVLLSRMGVEEFEKKYPGEKANANTQIDSQFLKYWQGHGALAQQGFAIGPARDEIAEDGKTYRTQYFERAVMEYHPENAGTEYEVLLKRIGDKQYKDKYPNGHGGTEAPPPQFGGWRPEYGDRESNHVVIHNNGVKFGFEDSQDPANGFIPMTEAVKKFFPNDHFKFEIFDDPAKLAQFIAEKGITPKYDAQIEWGRTYPGAPNGRRVIYQEANGDWVDMQSYPDLKGADPKLQNQLRYESTLNMLDFFFQKDNGKAVQPTDYNKVKIQFALAPYYQGTGPMNFPFKVEFAGN